MQKNEQLRSPETLSSQRTAHQQVESELTLERAERVFTVRTQMLSSLNGLLSPRLNEALKIKIDHEKASMLEMLEADAQAVEAHKKRNKILDYTYFKKKSLNLNNL